MLKKCGKINAEITDALKKIKFNEKGLIYMEKATIYEFARMCKANVHKCENCPMWNYKCVVFTMSNTDVDKANEIILKWCKEHPVETRQDRFLKMFPKMKVDNGGVSVCCPKWADKDFKCDMKDLTCDECRKKYWLAEVEE